MCGIIALYSSYKKLPEKSRVYSALECLHHRGPDEANLFYSKQANVALGHVRLSIVGYSKITQPLVSDDEKIVVVVNGEFYGYKKIKQELIAQGYNFRTDTDSEILLHLYRQKGLNCLDSLNGEFAFIIWDQSKHQIIAARDRFGVKPLYFTIFENSLYAASEIKALFNLGVSLGIDKDGLSGFLFGMPGQNKTCFSNICQIKPGSYIIYDGNKLVEKHYWDWGFNVSNAFEDANADELIGTFKEKLLSSVKKRLIADVPVGCYLSGGIDSSAVLALAVQANSKIESFNIAFDEEDYNENSYAASVSNALDVKLHTLQVTQEDLAENYHKAIYHRESPVYQTSGVAKFLLSKFTSSLGFKAVLTGEGADELLCGYPSFREDYIATLSESNKLRLFAKLQQENQKVSSAYVSEGAYSLLGPLLNTLGFIPSFAKLSLDIGNKMQKVLLSDFLIQESPANLIIKIFNGLAPHKTWQPISKSQYLWSKTFFPELILSYLGDRMEMAHSIEGRLPFLDTDLVNFICSLPSNMKIHDDLTDKYILRESMKGLIPDSVRLRQKHIFAAPSALKTERFKISPVEQLMLDIFSSTSFKSLGIFNQNEILKLLMLSKNTSPREKMISEFVLNLALSTYFLLTMNFGNN